MTSLGQNCFVGTLNYDELVPPIAIGVDNLQQTCDIGNTTTTPIIMSGASAVLSFEGTSAPNVKFANEDIRIIKGTQSKNISIGYEVGTANDNRTVEIGSNITNAGGECVCIGSDIATGVIAQGKFSVAIGKGSGQTAMGGSCVAIGTNAGNTNQGIGILPQSQSIAIGLNAGAENQGGSSIGIGAGAGEQDQKIECVAVGKNAGKQRQQKGSIALGAGAGASRQGTNSISLGYNCCPDLQGNDSIAIGSVGLGLPANAVAISAGGIVLTPGSDGLFIKPIRSVASGVAGMVSKTLWYDSARSEILYQP